MLSGGLDSSGLTALAGREFQHAGKTLNSYSIDFVDSAEHFHDQALRPSLDGPWVQRVSEHVGTQHHTIMVDTPELVEHLLVPMRAHDLPTIGQIETSRNRKKSAYPTSQHPAYLQAVSEWTLRILDSANEPVHALVNVAIVRAIAEGKAPFVSDDMVVSLCERVIQLNAWLKEYHVILSI